MRNRIKPIDSNSDRNGFLYQKIGNYISEEVIDSIRNKSASLSDAAFAWPEKRMFPIFSKEAACISYAYAKEQQEVLPLEVSEKLAEALELFDVSEVVIPQKKEASLDSDCFLFEADRKIPVVSAETVKTAESLLYDNHKELNLVARTYAFRRLKSKADEFGVKLASEAISFAAEGRCRVTTLCEQLRKRQEFCKEANVKKAYKHIEKCLIESKEQFLDDIDSCDKIASTIYDLDTESGVESMYGKRGFKDAVLSVFNENKTASDYVDLAGNQVPIEDVMRVDPNQMASIVGDDFVNDILDSDGNIDPQELSQTLAILPEDMKQELYSQFFGR